jgi:hypothetical protein
VGSASNVNGLYNFTIPKVGNKVQIKGERGVYLVLRVDRQRYIADLLLMTGKVRVEFGVQFSAIEIMENQGTLSPRILKEKLPPELV